MSAETKELKAGRTLDSLIAEKVMGLRYPADRCRICGWELGESVDQGCVEGNCSMRPAPEVNADQRFIPRYSSDISAAWSVLEKMRELREVVGIDFDPRNDGWTVEAYDIIDHESGLRADGSPGRQAVIASSSSAPEAICRASLQAVRGGGE